MEVRFYRVKGRMLLRHYKNPEWRKFTIDVRAVKPEHAVEKVLSELGSRHKVKRYHIVIESVEPISPEELEDMNLLRLAELKRWVKVD
ncbi:MAG: 50S ribosomal protein L18a [Crenarchaeota archaeon]|nr:50S ribosomal protein L18a [Thermoproteota archaeon]